MTMWQSVALMAASAASQQVSAEKGWCFNPAFHGPVSQVDDVKYVVPDNIPNEIERKLQQQSVVSIGGSSATGNEYYVRAGIIAPAGLSKKELYTFARQKTIDFEFYYNPSAHALIAQSFVFYNAPLVRYNVILKIKTPKRVDSTFVQCSGGF